MLANMKADAVNFIPFLYFCISVFLYFCISVFMYFCIYVFMFDGNVVQIYTMSGSCESVKNGYVSISCRCLVGVLVFVVLLLVQ